MAADVDGWHLRCGKVGWLGGSPVERRSTVPASTEYNERSFDMAVAHAIAG
jgi:hypothetical protein